MPVGTGSIKRAAKAKGSAAKAAEKKPAVKKTAADDKKVENGQDVEAARPGGKGQEICHLTEELPVYLL